MTTKPKGDVQGPSTTDVPTEPVVEPTEPSMTDDTTPSQAPVDERFTGKSPEELVEIIKGTERHAGTLAQQLDDERNKIAMYESSVPTQQPQQTQQGYPQAGQWGQMPQATAPQPDVKRDEELDNQFIDSPTKATRSIIQEEMGKFSQVFSLQQSGVAKQQAKTMFPEAFEGLNDQEIDQKMFGGIQGGMVNPMLAADPHAWKMIAWQLKGEKSGFKFNQPIKTQTTIPPTPVATDVPAQARADTIPQNIPNAPAGWDEVWNKMNVTEEERKRILERMAKGKK